MYVRKAIIPLFLKSENQKKMQNSRCQLVCFRTSPHSTEIPLLRTYQISRTKSSRTNTIESSIARPKHQDSRCIDTRAVIKLKGFAISSLEYSIQKSRKRMHIERTGATTCPCSFRIRGYTNRMSNRESGSSNGENWSLCVQPLYPPYCSVVRKYPPCSALPHPFHRFEKSSIFPATLFPPRSVESTGDKVISLCYALPARWSARATLQLFGNWRTQAIVSAIWPVRKSLTSRYYRRFTVSGGGGGFSRGKSG